MRRRGAASAGGRTHPDRAFARLAVTPLRPTLAAVALTLLATTAAAETRWTLVVGNNAGLRTEEPLRYAESDARKVKQVLLELGGASPAHATEVIGLNTTAVRTALDAMRKRMEAEGTPGDRLTVFVSSHASEEALHLDGTTLPLSELVEFVKHAPAAGFHSGSRSKQVASPSRRPNCRIKSRASGSSRCWAWAAKCGCGFWAPPVCFSRFTAAPRSSSGPRASRWCRAVPARSACRSSCERGLLGE